MCRTHRHLIMPLLAGVIACAPGLVNDALASSGNGASDGPGEGCRRIQHKAMVRSVEALAAISSALGWGQAAAGLDSLQGKLSATDSVGRAAAHANNVLNTAFGFLESMVDTSGDGVPVLVFNPCSWTRTDSVSVDNPFVGENTYVKVTDPLGRVRAARAMGDSLQFTARDVPALGYKVFWIERSAEPIRNAVQAAGRTLQNEFFRVTVDADACAILGIRDLRTGQEVVAPGGAFGSLQILERSVGKKGEGERIRNIKGPTEVIVVNSGPARATVNMDSNYRGSPFVSEIVLYDGVPRIDLRITADWTPTADPGKPSAELWCSFKTALTDPVATFGSAHGSAEAELNGMQLGAFNWMDLSARDRGISILADCAELFTAARSSMRAALIRSDDPAMRETHIYIYPHAGDWRAADTVRRGIELNQPLVARMVEAHEGDLPGSRPFVVVSQPGVVVSSLRQSADGSVLLLQLTETHGAKCTTNVRVNLPVIGWVNANEAEPAADSLRQLSDGVFSVELGANQTITIKLFRG